MKLKITVNPYDNEKFKGYANIVLDDKYALENVKIFSGSNGNLYTQLPSYSTVIKDNNGIPKKDVNGQMMIEQKSIFHPITANAQKQLNSAILTEYQNVMEQGKENRKNGGMYVLDCSMNITRTVATPFERENDNIRGFATVWFGNDFVLEKVKIKEGENGLYISLPSYTKQVKGSNGQVVKDSNGKPVLEYKDAFHPITANAHSELKTSILEKLTDNTAKIEQSIGIDYSNTLGR